MFRFVEISKGGRRAGAGTGERGVSVTIQTPKAARPVAYIRGMSYIVRYCTWATMVNAGAMTATVNEREG